MERRNHSRNEFLDYLKGISIILVFIGHCIQYGSGEVFFYDAGFFENNLFKFIYSFHMPLFMLVSGYLFYYTVNRYSTKQVLVNRIKNVLIPIVAWGILSECIVILKNIIGHDPIILYEVLYNFVRITLLNLWFLWAVLYCSLAVVFVRRFFNDSIWMYLLFFMASFILPDQLNMHLYKFMYPYFVSAYLFNKFNAITLTTKLKKWQILICSGLIFFIMLSIYNKDTFIYNTGITLIGKNIPHQITINLFRWAIGYIGSIFVICLSKLSFDSITIANAKKLIVEAGMNSLGLYILNSFMNQLLIRLTSKFTLNYMIIMAETVIMLILALFINNIIKRIPIMNKILLGYR